MPRLTRLTLAGCTHHVIQRGNNRQPVFVDDTDRRIYLAFLRDALAGEGCALHAYVLMTNHVHLLLTTGGTGVAGGLGRVMQSLGRRYVGHVNRAHDRTGTLFEGRYRATILDSEPWVLACYRYIELNPVRAGLTSSPAEHPWSSHRRNALGRRDALVTEHATYRALGATAAERRAAYAALVDRGLDERQLATLRDATQRGWVPGRARFKKEIAAALGRPVDPPRRGRPPKTPPRTETAVRRGRARGEDT